MNRYKAAAMIPTIVIVFSLLISQPVFAIERAPAEISSEDMTTFLKSCGYGSAVGAALGFASLAFSEDPGQKLNNIAKGASLGLYAGIILGVYLVNQNRMQKSYDYSGIMILPNQSSLFGKDESKIDGAVAVYTFRPF